MTIPLPEEYQPDENFPCDCGLFIPFRDDEEWEDGIGVTHTRTSCFRYQTITLRRKGNRDMG